MKKNKGYAMVSTLAISSVLLLAVGVMMYKINSNTKDIIRAKLNAQALNVAEEGIEHTLNWLNVQNTSTQTPPLLNTLLTSNLNLPGVISTINVFKYLKKNEKFKELKKEFGKDICFHGAIDVQKILPFGSKKDIENEVKMCMEILGENSGYICAPSHNLQPDIPVENIIYMYECARD
jgi:hypothetical protein